MPMMAGTPPLPLLISSTVLLFIGNVKINLRQQRHWLVGCRPYHLRKLIFCQKFLASLCNTAYCSSIKFNSI
jgi:hypothetical protein